MARWTRFVLRFRWPILAVWLVVLLAGGLATSKLTPLLSNTFTVPGTDSERARTILQEHFGDRSDGEFLVIYKIRNGSAGVRLKLERSIRSAAAVVPGGKATALRDAAGGVVYGSILSRLNLADAKGYTDDILKRLQAPPGVDGYVSGQAAIQDELDPIFNEDLKKGESIAIPIGLGIAIDYSLLIVYRFREELEAGGSRDDAILRTMATAGRAVIFSGATVAIGLALLLFMPLPFMRSMGVGGFLIPLVSI